MDITEIARMAGVSRSTVSRYLNDGYVSTEKREAIKRVIEETGYTPSQQAKTLRTGKTDVIGVILPKINSASVSRIVGGITSVLNDRGYRLLLANTNNNGSAEVDYLRLFSEGNEVDGIILIATYFDDAHLKAMANLSVPIVIIDQELGGYSCVYQDDYHALLDLTQIVLRHAEHPAYVGVLEKDVSAGHNRRQGFLDACAKAGVEVPERACELADFTVDSGYEATERLLDAYPELDAVVCATDSIAYGAMTCLHEFGHAVPDEVQVCGVGDSDLSQIVTPTLTTVHFFYWTSGTEAARMLLERIADRTTVARQLRMGYEVRVRNSTL
ncbi:MAG: LacI family transcriptional regulator [Coriobacteriaceae bacterium]|nr:MAG: LacI family transcriptional regulator [Coriobacteriaceae bacterium]